MIATVRIEKRKWDGSIAARESGLLLDLDETRIVWLVPAGTRRRRPRKHLEELVDHHELWFAPRRCGWVVCVKAAPDGQAATVVVHAALPIEARPGTLAWVDLDLDLEARTDGTIALRDVDDLAVRAAELRYPREAVEAAWAGIGDAAGRFARREWPFEGTLDRVLRPD